MLETNATWRAEFEQQVAEGKAAVSHTFNFTFNCQVNTTSATPKTGSVTGKAKKKKVVFRYSDRHYIFGTN